MKELHWIGLKVVPGIGNVTFRRLLERFETPETVFSAPPSVLSSVRGVTPAIREAISNGAWRGFSGAECLQLATSGARLVTFTSTDYPKSLFEIPGPPQFLHVRREMRCHEISVAIIVGSRRATAYGIQATTRLAESLAVHGVLP
jgi:DNA processing protein